MACKIVEPCQAKDCITVEGALGQDAAREQQDEGAEAGECAVVAAESVLLDDVTEFVAEPVDPWSTGAEGVVRMSVVSWCVGCASGVVDLTMLLR